MATHMQPAKVHKQPAIPESEIRITKTSILMVAALVVFSLLIVAYARITDNGTFKTGGPDITQIGVLSYEPQTDGFALVGDGHSFSATDTAFAKGAIRSLERMNGGALAQGTVFNVLQLRGGQVFLENTTNGDRISLDAFSRAKAASMADALKSVGGGTADGS
ncbi:MAG: hypothetical protein AAFP99_05770 [Pseudomonadota bacterium]